MRASYRSAGDGESVESELVRDRLNVRDAVDHLAAGVSVGAAVTGTVVRNHPRADVHERALVVEPGEPRARSAVEREDRKTLGISPLGEHQRTPVACGQGLPIAASQHMPIMQCRPTRFHSSTACSFGFLPTRVTVKRRATKIQTSYERCGKGCHTPSGEPLVVPCRARDRGRCRRGLRDLHIRLPDNDSSGLGRAEKARVASIISPKVQHNSGYYLDDIKQTSPRHYLVSLGDVDHPSVRICWLLHIDFAKKRVISKVQVSCD
jgi:hypothetical protein